MLQLTGNDNLLDGTPWLARSIDERNPYVDSLNLIQVELIKKAHRIEAESGEVSEKIRSLVRQSIQGVSAGMRTTG